MKNQKYEAPKMSEIIFDIKTGCTCSCGNAGGAGAGN